MPERNYLLFIDENPIDEHLKNYFAQFNIAIVHQSKLPIIHQESKAPIAILIHWSVINQDLQAIHQCYTTYPVPLLVINDYPDEEMCINVLESGADDFIIQPIYPRELHARISAINRRVKPQVELEKNVFVFKNWRLYSASRRVFNEKNQELSLSVGEYELLLIFVQQPQKILDREFLLQMTKNSTINPFDRRIDVQISRLRQKIEIDAKNPLLIKTVRNGGYMFTAAVETFKENDLLG